MLEAVRKYATKVLLLHFMLLVLVVAIVIFASRSVYLSARQQAIGQSSERLELLAQQTGRGIENYYLSVMADLDAILRDDPMTSPPSVPATEPATQRGPGGPRLINRRRPMGEGRPIAVTQGLTGIMWRQLRGRVSNLFLIDNDTGRVLAAYPTTSDPFARDITKDHLDWFKTLKVPSMSHLLQPSSESKIGQYHLIAIPAFENPRNPVGGGGGGGAPGGFGRNGGGPGSGGGPPAGDPNNPPPTTAVTVVAVVPVKIVKEEFFDPLNTQHVVNAALLDETGTALVSIDSNLDGTNVIDNMPTEVRDQVKAFVAGRKNGHLVIDHAYSIGSEEFSPRIIAFDQIEGLPGRQWTILASSPLSDAETLVNNVFGDALFWAVFVTLSITAILVSSSTIMIRSRVKLERQRHDLLKRELDQARQIQMAWLPDVKTAPAGLQVWAANLPASHISGDFYNWFELPAPGAGSASPMSIDLHDHPEASSKIAIVIGDVTGHGMAAAFLMATTQLLVRTTLMRYQDPGRCLQEVNRQLCMQGFRGQFVTMLVMILDRKSNSIEIAAAGHPSPLVERMGKFVSLEMEPQLVLGVDPTEQYKSQGFILQPGSSLLLYTDGVIEAEDSKGNQYGLDRLTAIPVNEPHPCIDSVLEDVKRFCQDKDLHDDVTLVAVRTMP